MHEPLLGSRDEAVLRAQSQAALGGAPSRHLTDAAYEHDVSEEELEEVMTVAVASARSSSVCASRMLKPLRPPPKQWVRCVPVRLRWRTHRMVRAAQTNKTTPSSPAPRVVPARYVS